ncbi:MAG TPA: hypothetical protein VF785_01615 [Gemmatimonadaceae bacterium]
MMTQGWTDLEAGNFREAIPFREKATTMGAPPFVTAYLAYAYGAAGDRRGEMEARCAQEDVERWSGAAVQSGARVSGSAITRVRSTIWSRALTADSQMMAWLGRHSMFDSLRSEPRFITLMKKLNLD